MGFLFAVLVLAIVLPSLHCVHIMNRRLDVPQQEGEEEETTHSGVLLPNIQQLDFGLEQSIEFVHGFLLPSDHCNARAIFLLVGDLMHLSFLVFTPEIANVNYVVKCVSDTRHPRRRTLGNDAIIPSTIRGRRVYEAPYMKACMRGTNSGESLVIVQISVTPTDCDFHRNLFRNMSVWAKVIKWRNSVP